MISRCQEEESPWGCFTATCGTSLGLGAGKLRAVAIPTWWHAWHASFLLLPTQSTEVSSCRSLLHGSRVYRVCQSRRAFPPWLVIRGGGGSLRQWGGVCWRLHGKGCPWPQLWLCTQQLSWLWTGVSESGWMTQSMVQFLLKQRCANWKLLWTPWRSYDLSLCHATHTREAVPAQG